jgi:V/A-type H+-transporting ATPase subunit E
MDNKLEELTQKIYSEGVMKAEQEAEAIREKSQKEAAGIIAAARKEAETIVAGAEEHAREIRRNVDAELKLSASQMISSLKQRITDLILLKIIDEPVKKAYNDREFLRHIIEILVRNWSAAGMGGEGLTVSLPPAEEHDLAQWLEKEQHRLLAQGLDIQFDDTLASGFRISPKDGNYKLSFTDEDFANFLKAYLRPRTNRLLYGGE